MKKLMQDPSVDSWRALMSAFQKIYHFLDKSMGENGCSLSRFQVLFFLYFEGGLSPIEISKKMLVSRGNISMFLKRMQEDGLVQPQYVKNLKRPIFVLTKKGRLFFEEIFPGHILRVKKIMPILTKKVRTQLREVQIP